MIEFNSEVCRMPLTDTDEANHKNRQLMHDNCMASKATFHSKTDFEQCIHNSTVSFSKLTKKRHSFDMNIHAYCSIKCQLHFRQ